MFWKNQIIEFNKLKQDPIFIWSAIVSLVGIGLTLILLFIIWSKLPPVVPFFYSLPWGEEQLTPLITLIVVLIGAIFLYLFNFGLAFLLYHFSVFYSRLLLVAACITCLLTSVTVINIIFLML